MATLSLAAVACRASLPDPPAGSRTITIETPDRERLDAVEMGEGSDIVVFSHGANGTKEGFYAAMEAFAADGWRAIAYDARGTGASTGSKGADRDVDLRAVVDHARASGAETIVLVGGSLGAGLSLSMAEELDAAAVVSLSSPRNAFGAVEAAGTLREAGIPVMVMASADDAPFADDARAIAEAAGVTAVIVDGAGHGSGVFDEHPEVIPDVVAFADAEVAGGGERGA